MRYENKTEPRVAKFEPRLPREPGFYWAKWRIPEDGTADEEHFVTVDVWEVVEVHAALGETDEDYRVSVAGVVRTQSVENFVWAQPCVPIKSPPDVLHPTQQPPHAGETL